MRDLHINIEMLSNGLLEFSNFKYIKTNSYSKRQMNVMLKINTKKVQDNAFGSPLGVKAK